MKVSVLPYSTPIFAHTKRGGRVHIERGYIDGDMDQRIARCGVKYPLKTTERSTFPGNFRVCRRCSVFEAYEKPSIEGMRE